MEPVSDREHLLVLNTKFDEQMKVLKEHVEFSKKNNEHLNDILFKHNTRITKLEIKAKPLIFKIFSAIGAFFIGK